MELYQLKTFLAVANEQHLTRAAERLHVSQSSVSTHIKALEQELGVLLFIRTPKGMTLSREGERIKAKAASVLQAVDAVQQQADQLKENVSGIARIGLNIAAQYLKASELQTQLHDRFPKLELHYFQRHSLEAIAQVQSALLDVAYVFNTPTNSGLDSHRLARVGIAVVAPYQWIDRIQQFDLEALVEFPWIWTDNRCPFNRIIKQMFDPLGRLPKKAAVVDQDTTIRELVASGVGLGLMVEPEAREAVRQKQALILTDGVSNLDLSVVYLKKRQTEPIIDTIVRTLRDVWS